MRYVALAITLGLLAITPPALALPFQAASPGAGACRDTARTPSTTAVVRTIAVGTGPQGVAVDSADDTVYVANAQSDTLSVIDGASANVVATIPGFAQPYGVATHEVDDVVYVANSDDSSVVVLDDGGRGSRSTLPIAGLGTDVAVDQDDDTVYATVVTGGESAGALAVIDGRGRQVRSTVPIVDNGPVAIAVNSLDDQVYVTGQNAVGASILDGRTLSVEDTIPLIGSYWGVAVHEASRTAYFAEYAQKGTLSIVSGQPASVTRTAPTRSLPWGVAVEQSDNLVYVAHGTLDQVSVFDGLTGKRLVQGLEVGDFPSELAVDQAGENAGVVYVTNSNAASVSVLATVRPRIVSANGPAGAVARISVSIPQADFDADGSTVHHVCFRPTTGGPGYEGTRLRPRGGDAWTVQTPTRMPRGSYQVIVEFDGGLSARAGRYTVTP